MKRNQPVVVKSRESRGRNNMLKGTRFTGTGTALVTPFRNDGALDELALEELIQRQIDRGIDFLVPCGTTGESPTLTHEEHLRVVEITVNVVKGKVPVLAGAGGYNTREVIVRARELAEIGRSEERRVGKGCRWRWER